MYPAQVRVEYCPRCPPMEEQYFKPAIAANYFNPNRFRWELNERQASISQYITSSWYQTAASFAVGTETYCIQALHASFLDWLSNQWCVFSFFLAVSWHKLAALDVQVEELLDLFLGVGAPWPPESRQPRVENRETPAFVEDASTRPYTIEPVARPRLEAHRERNSPYTSDARCIYSCLIQCLKPSNKPNKQCCTDK